MPKIPETRGNSRQMNKKEYGFFFFCSVFALRRFESWKEQTGFLLTDEQKQDSRRHLHVFRLQMDQFLHSQGFFPNFLVPERLGINNHKKRKMARFSGHYNSPPLEVTFSTETGKLTFKCSQLALDGPIKEKTIQVSRTVCPDDFAVLADFSQHRMF